MSTSWNDIASRNGHPGVDDLWRRMPGYLPGLSLSPKDPGRALMLAFAHYMDLLESGLEQVPDRSFLAFLQMMGTDLLPAQAARAPLVFSLLEGTSVDVTVPARSQVAAVPPPALPTLVQTVDRPAGKTEPIVFATDQAITVARSRLATLYSIVPGSDEFAEHTKRLTTGFTLFGDLEPTEHAIYLGHDQLFALAGDITVLLSFSLDQGAGRSLSTHWEYFTDSGWLSFSSLPEDDTTSGLRRDGIIGIRRACGPDAKKATFAGRASFWLRGRLTTPLLPQEVTGKPPLPVINDIRASVEFGRSDLLPEAAFADGVVLDVTKNFYPFGSQPAPHAVFYLASKEVFQHKRARVSITTGLSQKGELPKDKDGKDEKLELIWEYAAGASWRLLFEDDTADTVAQFRESGTISFFSPADWAEVNVNGVKNYWLRVRIAKGGYGSPLSVKVNAAGTLTPTESTLKPPIVGRLTLSYAYVTDPEPLDHCLAHNDFVFEDQTEACLWPDQSFTPFQLVADRQPAVHFGFDRQLPVGLVSIYVDVPDTGTDSLPQSSPFIWEYRSARGWTELSVLDETIGFRRSGMVQFVGPPDVVATPGLGDSRFRIRARLKGGERVDALPITGMWLNAVWATHGQTFDQEPLGPSDGNPGQTFSARRWPVLSGESLEVQEWTGRGEYWRAFVHDVAESDLRFERDPVSGEATAVWVRWRARPHLHDSSATDRHYLIERARGLVTLGDGTRGMIPPAGSRVSLSYRSGGGPSGNVPTAAISQLHTAVPFIMGATNPVPARGGAAIEAMASVTARGPQRLRHRDRAVTPGDFEWLAREASPEIARARCLPLSGPDGHAQRGWVTIVIVPHSGANQPNPTTEVRRRVREFVAARVPASTARHVRVEGPRYVAVSVAAEIVPLPGQSPAVLEARVRGRLDRFLHPLTGGVAGGGWDFGEPVHLSHIASIIEGTEGVAYARDIGLSVQGRIFADSVAVEPDMLVAPGDHELKLVLESD